MSDTLIKVERLYKKFTRNLHRSMWYGTKDTIRSMFNIPYETNALRKSEFWALQNINFELKRGEVLGLIGRNGCGKSTLLRLLTGIYPPDKGRITMKGRVGALIAVGAGFHPHMTGRENIYLNGTILGMNRHELKKRFDEIVEFAEIGEFIDAPVATYSSGMRVRLGFSIAAHIEPDILLIDEVLAVGDTGFKKKSLNKIQELLSKCAVVFVSHSMPMIARTVSDIMLLKDGKSIYQGEDVEKGITKYNDSFEKSNKAIWGGENITILSFDFYDNNNLIENNILKHGKIITIKIKLKILKKLKNSLIHLDFTDNDLKRFGIITSQKSEFYISGKAESTITIEVKWKNELTPNKYSLDINVTEFDNNRASKRITLVQNIKEFQVVPGKQNIPFGHIPVMFDAQWKINKV